MPLKPVIVLASPPVTTSFDQSQVPVQAPDPQFTATRWASLLTEMEVVDPTKLTPDRMTPVPGVPRVSG